MWVDESAPGFFQLGSFSCPLSPPAALEESADFLFECAKRFETPLDVS